jgi:formyltetrahydrofolate synthetase
VASVRASDGGDVTGMAASGEPVVNGSADTSALNRRLARTMVAGNQQNHPVTARDRLLETWSMAAQALSRFIP